MLGRCLSERKELYKRVSAINVYGSVLENRYLPKRCQPIVAKHELVKKKQHRQWREPTSPRLNGIQRRSVGLKRGVALFALVAMATCISIVWSKHHLVLLAANRQAGVQEANAKSPVTLNDLLALPPAEIEHCDIALMNLLCAQGLPGAEGLDVTNCLFTLDAWARHVQAETDRNFHQFRDNPADFYNSEGYFRMLIMAAVMYEDFAVRYNPARIIMPGNIDPNDHFFADSNDIFLHGLLGDLRMGTCSSMPILYIAVGRRLGYPLKLVTTKAHLFVRWESKADRFDVEATGKGMNRYDDEHFRQWPFHVSDEEVQTEGYLKSLTPPEELAVFLSLRGNCLKEAGRKIKAASCYAAALRLTPGWNAYRVLLADVQNSPSVATSQQIQLPMSAAMILQVDGQPQQSSGMPDPNPLLNIR